MTVEKFSTFKVNINRVFPIGMLECIEPPFAIVFGYLPVVREIVKNGGSIRCDWSSLRVTFVEGKGVAAFIIIGQVVEIGEFLELPCSCSMLVHLQGFCYFTIGKLFFFW